MQLFVEGGRKLQPKTTREENAPEVKGCAFFYRASLTVPQFAFHHASFFRPCSNTGFHAARLDQI